MRIVFFGSPDFALSSLERLVAEGHEIALVVSQPKKPVGRKAVLTDPPAAARARELGLPVFQPDTLKSEEAVARLGEVAAEVFVVIAYGKLLPQRVLDLPRLGCLNVHGSVLPRWRGASPVQAALLHGDTETGVSIMRMAAGLDTGPVYAVERTVIGADEDAGGLSSRLARMGADLLVRVLPRIADDSLPALPQESAGATLCPKIRREDGAVDFARPALEIARRARAFTPWPGLFAFRNGARVKLSAVRASPAGVDAGDAPPGTVLSISDAVVVACGTGALEIGALQAEGRRALPAPEFTRGEHMKPGEVWT